MKLSLNPNETFIHVVSVRRGCREEWKHKTRTPFTIQSKRGALYNPLAFLKSTLVYAFALAIALVLATLSKRGARHGGLTSLSFNTMTSHGLKKDIHFAAKTNPKLSQNKQPPSYSIAYLSSWNFKHFKDTLT